MSSTSRKENQESNAMQAMCCLSFPPNSGGFSSHIQYNMSLPLCLLATWDSNTHWTRFRGCHSKTMEWLQRSTDFGSFRQQQQQQRLQFSVWGTKKRGNGCQGGNHILPNFCNPTQSCSPWCYSAGAASDFWAFQAKFVETTISQDHSLWLWCCMLRCLALQTWLGQTLVEKWWAQLACVFCSHFWFK